jgi:plasmid stabilization system protein ParE
VIPVIVRPAAAADVDDARRWYETRRPGLGDELLVDLADGMSAISAEPGSFQIVHRGTRRALLRRFPYGIFYQQIGDTVVVIAVMHVRRSPRRWKHRS